MHNINTYITSLNIKKHTTNKRDQGFTKNEKKTNFQ